MPARDGGRYITGGTVALGESVRQYGASAWGVDLRDLYQGSYATPWSERLGQPGIPMSGGQLRLEYNPRYLPVQARGQGSDVGAFWRLSKMPQAQRALKGPADAISGSSVRLEAPPIHDWQEGEDASRARQFQLELCQRAMAQWQTPTEDGSGWRRFVREILFTAPVCGFAWFEILADTHQVDLGLYEVTRRAGGQPQRRRVGSVPRRVLIPRVPEWRAPWAVQYWLTQQERLVGVDARFDQSSDYRGTQGRYRTIIPREKILLVTHRRVGSNFEGTSAFREASEFLTMLQASLRTEALAVEINGLGELVIYEPPEGGFNKTADGDGASDYQRVQDYLNHRSTKIGNGLILPHGSRAEVLTPQSQMPDLGPMQDRLERMIMMGLDAESTLIATQGHGSYAARADASAAARDTYDAVFQELIADPVERLWAQMIRINFAEDWNKGLRFVPQLCIGQVEERDNSAWLGAIKTAADAKAITLGIEDEDVIRDLLDLPALTEEARAARGQGSGDMAPSDKLQQGRLALDAIFAPAPVGPFFARLLGVPSPTDEERAAYLVYKNGGAPPAPADALTATSPDLDEAPGPPAPDAPPGRYDHVDLAPPQDVRSAAAWALECSRQRAAADRLSAADRLRAITLSKGLPLNLSTLQRLKAYHDNTPSQSHLESTQDMAWLVWQAAGGDAGRRWVDEVVGALDAPPPVVDEGTPPTFAGAALTEEWTPLGEGTHAGLFLRLSDRIDALRGPLPQDPSPAHVTLLYAGGLDEEGQRVLAEAVRPYLGQRFPVTLGPVRVLINGKGQPVVYQQAVFSPDVRADLESGRTRIIQALEGAGHKVNDFAHREGQAWEPHLTRGYFDSLANVVVPAPIKGGTWATLELWGMPADLLVDEEAPLAEAPAKYSHIEFKPTAGMVEAAKRALTRRAAKPPSQRGMTPVGLARARDISNGRALSPDTWRRVKAYFDRHESDKSGETWDDYGKGRQAWDGWGGDAGQARATVVVRQMDAADEEDAP